MAGDDARLEVVVIEGNQMAARQILSVLVGSPDYNTRMLAPGSDVISARSRDGTPMSAPWRISIAPPCGLRPSFVERQQPCGTPSRTPHHVRLGEGSPKGGPTISTGPKLNHPARALCLVLAGAARPAPVIELRHLVTVQ